MKFRAGLDQSLKGYREVETPSAFHVVIITCDTCIGNPLDDGTHYEKVLTEAVLKPTLDPFQLLKKNYVQMGNETMDPAVLLFSETDSTILLSGLQNVTAMEKFIPSSLSSGRG